MVKGDRAEGVIYTIKKIGICLGCGKPMTMKSSTKKYCSPKCEREYKKRTFGIAKICEICGNNFKAPPNNKEQRFCSRECQGKWQSTQTGRKNPRYKRVETTCDWCGKTYDMRNYMVGAFEHHFCSEECRKEWYSKEWSQSEEWKNESSIRAVKMLKDGISKKTDTTPQLKLNKILDSMKLTYENEYNCMFYSIDNAIFYNNDIFFVEVMGEYWHCDRRKYEKILYDIQYNRITVDKAKKSYIEKTYGKNILYIWERDVDNETLCKLLIMRFLSKDLKLYHSSDYYINNGNLTINSNRIDQYMMLDNDCLKLYVEYTAKGRQRPQNQKQPDKWITYNCENCGKEKEMLISHYKKAKHHYCSSECRIEGQRKKSSK